MIVRLRQLDTRDDRIPTKVRRVLDEVVNPLLGTHSGAATLIDHHACIVSLQLEGGCQGCSVAGATLKEGIETSIRQGVPEVLEVRAVTNHANGSNPYFQ